MAVINVHGAATETENEGKEGARWKTRLPTKAAVEEGIVPAEARPICAASGLGFLKDLPWSRKSAWTSCAARSSQLPSDRSQRGMPKVPWWSAVR